MVSRIQRGEERHAYHSQSRNFDIARSIKKRTGNKDEFRISN